MNKTLVEYVAEAIGPQLHVLKENNPLITDEKLGATIAKSGAILALYLLARQAGIDSVDLDTGLIGPDDI